jgi:ferredoxin
MGMVYLPNVSTLTLNREKCVGCGSCLELCPHQILFLDQDRIACLDHDACMECGACAMNCPSGAISVEAGVGCATAVILSALRGDKQVCC